MSEAVKNLNADQKKEFNKTKHTLEEWRELILLANSLLKWDLKFFPGVIFGIVTVIFLLLCYLQLSLLTLFSLFFLTLTISDYVYPIVSKFIFKPDNWNGEQEKAFEGVVYEIFSIKHYLFKCCNCLFASKSEKSVVCTVSISALLVALAWIGSVINNLFLCYITVLSVCLYPGLYKHGIIKQIKDLLDAHVLCHLNKVKPAEKTE